MHPVLFIILVLVGVAIIVKLAFRQLEKRDEAKKQQAVDRNIEWQLEGPFNEMTIETLARHSDVEKMARIASNHIEDYVKMAVHPKKLSKLLQNLGLFTATRNNWGTKEITLAALIEQYTLRSLDSHDLDVYTSEACADRTEGFRELNRSFLTKVEKNMMIWNPLVN